MFDDNNEGGHARGGRGALIAAYCAVVLLVAAAFAYVFLVPVEDEELAELGAVSVRLNPSTATVLQDRPADTLRAERQTGTDGDMAGDAMSGGTRSAQPPASGVPGDTGASQSEEALLGGAPDTGASDGAETTGDTATDGAGEPSGAQTAAAPDTGTTRGDAADGDTGGSPAPGPTASDGGSPAPSPSPDASDTAATPGATAGGTDSAAASPAPDGSGGQATGAQGTGGQTAQGQDAPPAPRDTQTATRTPGQDDGGTAAAPAPGQDGPASQLTAPGGSTPAWQQYARVLSPPEGAARIAVIVRGLGLSSAATEAAIKRLPGEISLSFSPYARRSQEWTLRARARGHEVLMDLPMEPRDFPNSDPGPQALMSTTAVPRNLERLDWVLGNGQELVGVVGQMGSEFVSNDRVVGPLMRALKRRGLVYVDNGQVADNAAVAAARQTAVPFAVNDRTIDGGQVSRAAVQGRLVEAERIAEQNGVAVVLAHPYPVTIDLLEQWSRELRVQGMALVPITNVVTAPGRTEAAQLQQ